ncbi:MAG: bifunctional adenosylcobinamide kinase/adenosylcobinamide-phosphate guanylyltransferase [Clostridia bacterium]|jgi:adenosylcobinamide kinase/adenosylcobinamide-phosphate guanylyltransferase|nr:bifunctional adenosylcobinamide kinase/adenosylcobinamide-phosphate guanylyltransferase [Clostridia bacterium]
MKKVHVMTELVIGGSGSGKSEYAENLCMKIKGKGKLYYIAAMIPYGDEANKRIAKHRKMRADKGFETIEKYYNFHELKLDQSSTVLIECLSNLTANEIFELREKNAAEKIFFGVKNIIDQSKNVIIVSNDIFSEDCIYGNETEMYMKTLGDINYMLGNIADNVTEVLFSVPIKYKEG